MTMPIEKRHSAILKRIEDSWSSTCRRVDGCRCRCLLRRKVRVGRTSVQMGQKFHSTRATRQITCIWRLLLAGISIDRGESGAKTRRLYQQLFSRLVRQGHEQEQHHWLSPSLPFLPASPPHQQETQQDQIIGFVLIRWRTVYGAKGSTASLRKVFIRRARRACTITAANTTSRCTIDDNPIRSLFLTFRRSNPPPPPPPPPPNGPQRAARQIRGP
jgi:hypothetical protein